MCYNWSHQLFCTWRLQLVQMKCGLFFRLLPPRNCFEGLRVQRLSTTVPNRDDEQPRTRAVYPFEGEYSSYRPTRIERFEENDSRFYRSYIEDELKYNLASVTTILSHTKPRKNAFMLNNWKNKIVKKHGLKGFEKLKAQTLKGGTQFHEAVEQYLLKKCDTTPLSVKPSATHTSKVSIKDEPNCSEHDPAPSKRMETQNSAAKDLSLEYLKSAEHILEEITEVKVLESIVTHSTLGYSGSVDCVANYRNILCVVDWKTSSRPRPFLEDCYEYPLQVIAYAGALNEDPFYPFKVSNGLLVVAYTTGEPADAHFFSPKDCLNYWENWVARVEEYHTLFANDLSNVC